MRFMIETSIPTSLLSKPHLVNTLFCC